MTELSKPNEDIFTDEFGNQYVMMLLGGNTKVRLFQSMSGARLEGELFSEYKVRQKIIQLGLKHRKKYGIFA
jgi:hypothetical protein